MARAAFYLIVDGRYLPIALGLATRLVDLWKIDVHVFLEDKTVMDRPAGVGSRIFVHLNALDGLRPPDLPETHNWPAIVYDRVFAPRFLQDYDRLIYLDADIYPLHVDPSLLTVDLPSGLGAVQDTASIGFSPHAAKLDRPAWCASIGLDSDRYFNSGVLVIDRKTWNRIDFPAQLTRYMARYADAVRMPDQDFLNYLFQGRWTEFSPAVNFQKAIFNYGYERTFPPVFVHFSSFQKPWLKPDSPQSPHGQFFPLFQQMIRDGGHDPALVQSGRPESIMRRLRKTSREWLSRRGVSTRKEARQRQEWQERARHLSAGFRGDLKSSRYADTTVRDIDTINPDLSFDGQYLRRPLMITLQENA